MFQKNNENLNTTTLSNSFALTEETGIRRKSCCCRECGGISDFEKRTCYIVVHPKRILLKSVNPQNLDSRCALQKTDFQKDSLIIIDKSDNCESNIPVAQEKYGMKDNKNGINGSLIPIVDSKQNIASHFEQNNLVINNKNNIKSLLSFGELSDVSGYDSAKNNSLSPRITGNLSPNITGLPFHEDFIFIKKDEKLPKNQSLMNLPLRTNTHKALLIFLISKFFN